MVSWVGGINVNLARDRVLYAKIICKNYNVTSEIANSPVCCPKGLGYWASDFYRPFGYGFTINCGTNWIPVYPWLAAAGSEQ